MVCDYGKKSQIYEVNKSESVKALNVCFAVAQIKVIFFEWYFYICLHFCGAVDKTAGDNRPD